MRFVRPEQTPIEYQDPIRAFSKLVEDPFAMLLHGRGARFSYICAFPAETIVWSEGDGLDPLEIVQSRLGALPFERVEELPPFCGGWAGLLSYEFGRFILPKLEEGPAKSSWPDVALGLYDQVVVFDHEEKTATVYDWKWRETDQPSLSDRLCQGEACIRDISGRLSLSDPKLREERSAYEAKIQRVIDYVHAGDCFQTNLSQAFEFDLKPEFMPYDLLVRLNEESAAPFSAYVRLDQHALVSNSPERFLKVRRTKAGKLLATTQPIKGTRPRGKTPSEDQANAAELKASEKDRAENLMIVDLMRNDLSRVCKPGTVKVPKLNVLESFANVHHLVSQVDGELDDGMDQVDLIKAAFPGGSITGAPKIRAMQIIAELEDGARGPYCGSLVWMSPDGWMDSSILIRSTAFTKANNHWTGEFRVGGGIVADSTPADEYEETLDKAYAMYVALSPKTEDGAHE